MANLPNRYSALCWMPVTHAQTWASYSALYRFGRLSYCVIYNAEKSTSVLFCSLLFDGACDTIVIHQLQFHFSSQMSHLLCLYWRLAASPIVLANSFFSCAGLFNKKFVCLSVAGLQWAVVLFRPYQSHTGSLIAWHSLSQYAHLHIGTQDTSVYCLPGHTAHLMHHWHQHTYM